MSALHFDYTFVSGRTSKDRGQICFARVWNTPDIETLKVYFPTNVMGGVTYCVGGWPMSEVVELFEYADAAGMKCSWGADTKIQTGTDRYDNGKLIGAFVPAAVLVIKPQEISGIAMRTLLNMARLPQESNDHKEVGQTLLRFLRENDGHSFYDKLLIAHHANKRVAHGHSMAKYGTGLFRLHKPDYYAKIVSPKYTKNSSCTWDHFTVTEQCTGYIHKPYTNGARDYYGTRCGNYTGEGKDFCTKCEPQKGLKELIKSGKPFAEVREHYAKVLKQIKNPEEATPVAKKVQARKANGQFA